MKSLVLLFVNFLTSIDSWRNKWLQSQIKAYIDNFRQRSAQHKNYWFERLAKILILPLVEKQIVTGPNLISIFRGLMSFPLLIFIIDSHYSIALVFFIFITLLDAIDGPLARVLNQETDLGEILDPIGDKLVLAAILFTLGIKYLTKWVFVSTLLLELMIAFMGLVLKPIAKKLNLSFKKKSTLPGKVKFNLQAIGSGFLILDCLTNVSLNMAADIFFVISLPFALIANTAYFFSVRRK